jgi:hypothetical protein
MAQWEIRLFAVIAYGAISSVATAQDMPPLISPSSWDTPATPTTSSSASAVMAPGTPPGPRTATFSSTTVMPAAQPAISQAPALPVLTVAAAAPTKPQEPAVQPLSQAQLDRLLAPIALYPDPLLTQVLTASTYPLEIVKADHWVRQPGNKALTGDALNNALKGQDWDPSVMSLIPFPRLLALMSDQLEWTDQLGNAFLAQQTDVMNAVQRLRHEAMAAGNLQATPQCHCVILTTGETISILPLDKEVVCIPAYNPTVAYGRWPEPAYPPVVFPYPPGFVAEPGFAIGFYPPVELAVFGPLWGWGWFDWGHHAVVVDSARFGAIGIGHAAFVGGIWVHNPAHRGGVGYRDPSATAHFGAARVAALMAVGRGNQVHQPGAGAHFGGVATHFGGATVHAGRAGHRAGFISASGRGSFRAGGATRHVNFSPMGHGGGGPRFGGGGPHFGGGGHHH